jgi:hypothetical protein
MFDPTLSFGKVLLKKKLDRQPHPSPRCLTPTGQGYQPKVDYPAGHGKGKLLTLLVV